jgi:hypothetical protein
MATQVQAGWKIGNIENVDSRLGPYVTASGFTETVSLTRRYEGMTFIVTGSGIPQEYHLVGGVANENIQYKFPFPVVTSSNASSTTTIIDFITSSYDGAVVDYTIKNGNNVRTGTIIGSWDEADNIDYTETSINGVGDTSDAYFTFVVSNATASLQLTNTNSYSIVKTLSRAL